MIGADWITRALLWTAAACIAVLAVPPVLQGLSFVVAVWAVLLGAL